MASSPLPPPTGSPQETDPAAVAKELKLLEKAFAAHKQKEKATFAKMFSPAD